MSRTYAANDTEVPRATLSGLFLGAVDRLGDRTALEYFAEPGRLEGLSFREVFERVEAVAAGMEARGLEPGDRAAILSENRPGWAIADYACLCSGVISVPVYPTLTAPQVAYLLRDSGSRLVFVSTVDQMEKAQAAVAECEHDVRIVVFDAPPALPGGVESWTDFLAAGREHAGAWPEGELRRRIEAHGPDDLATVLYTSGTTGEPKGVMLTHGNVASNVLASSIVLPITTDDNTASFLPLSHILQRMVDYLFFHVGCRIAYPRSILTVVEDFAHIRPTVAVSVPRLYEKIYNGVMEAEGLKKRIIDWAVGVADRVAEVRLAGGEPSGLLALQYRLADRLVFTKVKDAVGGHLRFFVSGGAPLAPALNRFFYSIGLMILEGYGLTETSPVTNVNTPEDFRIGTVGKPIPGTEIRIADDGEILIRGPQVMKGYYNRPDDTAAVLDADGWFRSGDIGEIDDDGFLRITDRKKDIIVTAGGKNVAPQPLENRLKSNTYVEQVVMVGDKRKYVSLLVVPAFGPLESWARDEGVSTDDRAALVADPRVQSFMEEQVAGAFHGLASYEIPKRVALLDAEFTIADGTLTPTLKVKRRVVQERYADLIDGLYEDEAADATHG
ncbi:MAG: long-chain fatty acid--CoA ligase [Longimicrobiales bacterium]